MRPLEARQKTQATGYKETVNYQRWEIRGNQSRGHGPESDKPTSGLGLGPLQRGTLCLGPRDTHSFG